MKYPIILSDADFELLYDKRVNRFYLKAKEETVFLEPLNRLPFRDRRRGAVRSRSFSREISSKKKILNDKVVENRLFAALGRSPWKEPVYEICHCPYCQGKGVWVNVNKN